MNIAAILMESANTVQGRYHGKLTDDENDMARKVAAKLGLPGTGGSDAHRVDEVGRWVTVFEKDIHTEKELVEELHAGRFAAEKEG